MPPHSEETCYINFKDGNIQVFDPISIPDSAKFNIPSQHLSVFTPPPPPKSPQPIILTAPLNESLEREPCEAGSSTSHPGWPSQTHHHHPSILSAPIKRQLTSNAKATPISAITRANLLYFLVASNTDFTVPIDNRPGALLHPDDVADLRIITELFGSRKFFIFNVKDIHCRECVREKEESYHSIKTSKEALTSLKSKLITAIQHPSSTLHDLHTSILGHYPPYICTHTPKPMFLTLFHALGHSYRSLITQIRLVGNFSNPYLVRSAISNLGHALPCIHAVTISLHRPSKGRINTSDAYRLARLFAGLEKTLPEGERLKISRLREHKALMLEWNRRKRQWWLIKPGGNHVRAARYRGWEWEAEREREWEGVRGWEHEHVGMRGDWGLDYHHEWNGEGGEIPVMGEEMMPVAMRRT